MSTAEDGAGAAAGAAAAEETQSLIGYLTPRLLFILALCVPVALLGLFARKLLMSEKEKELRRLEKKKAKEQRTKKK